MERQNTNNSPTRQRVTSQVEDQNLANEGRNTVSKWSTVVFVILVLLAMGLTDHFFSKEMHASAEISPTPTAIATPITTSTVSLNNNYVDIPLITPVPTATPSIAPTNIPVITVNPTGIVSSTGIPTATAVPTATPTPAPQVMNNTGNALNEQEVNQRVVVIVDEFRRAGIINNETGLPYTFEEIKAILLYMNGAYIPENENEAYTITNKYLNMVCAPINTEKTLTLVNYMGGNTAISEETIDAYNVKYPAVNWMNFLLGDSNCSGYLKWINNHIMIMNSTSDKEVYNRSFEAISQSLADLCFGNGCVIDGHTYTLDDFMGLDDVNDGNLLQLMVYIYQIGRNPEVAQEYTITTGYGDAVVNLDSILACFNPFCNNDYLTNATYDENGLLVVDTNGLTFSQVNQINSVNNTLSNYHSNNLERYEDIYQKTK